MVDSFWERQNVPIIFIIGDVIVISIIIGVVVVVAVAIGDLVASRSNMPRFPLLVTPFPLSLLSNI